MKFSHFVRRVFFHFIDNRLIRWFSRVYSDLLLKKIIKGTDLIPIRYDEKSFVNQATHPDVLKKDDQYFLTVSGYPFEIEHLENPFLFCSDDGICFKSLHDGPVDAYTGTGLSHFSDGDIIYDDGRIVLYYRLCEMEKTPKTDDIFIKTYSEKNWSERKAVLSFQKDKCLSQSVVIINGHYEMYYVEMNQEWGSKLKRLKSDSYLFDSNIMDEVRINGMPEGRMLWHIDVVLDGEALMGLFALSTAKGGVDCRLYYGYSKDFGYTWEIVEPIETSIHEKWIKRIYRSSMVKVGGLWNIYISVCTPGDCWFVLLLEKQIGRAHV